MNNSPLTPGEVAQHRRDVKGETIITAICIVGLVVAVLLAWLYFVVPAADAGAQTQPVETTQRVGPLWPFNCHVEPHAPAHVGSSVASRFVFSCSNDADVRPSYVRIVGRLQVWYGGAWHNYGRRDVAECHCSTVSFRPLRAHCGGGYSYWFRQHVAMRVSGWDTHGIGDPMDIVIRRRLTDRVSDTMLACGATP